MNLTVQYSQKPLFEEPLNVGWYYGFNLDRKPLDSMFRVCKLMDQDMKSNKCRVLIYGEGFIKDVFTDDLVVFVPQRECDIRGLTAVLTVSAEQLQVWEQRVKTVNIRNSQKIRRRVVSGPNTRISLIIPRG